MIADEPQQATASSARRSKLPLIAATLLLLLAAAWAYTAPRRTLIAIREAAQAGNSERLAELVDFPAVRESLKEQLRASMVAEMEKTARESSDDPFAAAGRALGMMFATAVVDKLVDAAVSPSGIAKLASGDRPTMPQAGKDPGTTDKTVKDENVATEMGYESFSRYVVRFSDPDQPGQGVTLNLRREGLSWRLVNIRFEGLTGRTDREN